MNLLDTLTRAADEEQLRLRPLPDHAAASQPEHLRRHYALLLAAVLTAQPTISEPQTRLLRLLLDALKLGDLRGTLFEQARELTPEPLLEAARLIREAGFAHHLVLDALVLLRLDAPLGDEAARLAGELAAFCGLDEHQLATRAADAFEILGLDKAENSTDAEDPDAPRPLLLAEIWPNRLRQPLTREALRSGLQGGLWLLDANLDVDFPWQANDALLIFKNGATLNTFAKEGEIKITGCRLVSAVLDFQGACSIALERCDWQGNYDPEAKRTVLHSDGQSLMVADCNFSTRNARVICVKNNNLILKKNYFTHCGHAEIRGGAICWMAGELKYGSWYPDRKFTAEIKESRFFNCIGESSAAIFMGQLQGISECEFVKCFATGQRGAKNIAINSFQNGPKNRSIEKSSFRDADLFLYYTSSSGLIINQCQFQGGTVYVYKPHTEMTFLSENIAKCNFEISPYCFSD